MRGRAMRVHACVCGMWRIMLDECKASGAGTSSVMADASANPLSHVVGEVGAAPVRLRTWERSTNVLPRRFGCVGGWWSCFASLR